jgi:hypothetical protein
MIKAGILRDAEQRGTRSQDGRDAGLKGTRRQDRGRTTLRHFENPADLLINLCDLCDLGISWIFVAFVVKTFQVNHREHKEKAQRTQSRSQDGRDAGLTGTRRQDKGRTTLRHFENPADLLINLCDLCDLGIS